MTLNKGIWDPKLRGTNVKGTNLKSSDIEAPLSLLALWLRSEDAVAGPWVASLTLYIHIL